ncbi:MAG: HNH endonuclease [Tannerellaceae bacterium]|nr:HNH endonuclease [Tannerellaceae bacterium]
MSLSKIKYRFYPSLLDQFARYQRADKEFEDTWNQDKEGNYKKTFAEIEDQLKLDLLNSINRVPFDSEAADEGTVFNEIVDAFIHNKRPDKIQMKGDIHNDTITATYNNRTFVFSYQFCAKAAEYFYGASSQVFVRASLNTYYGIVDLYGYLDEIIKDVVYDIKTTSRYQYGKYADGWQKHVYPYCLIESGEMSSIKAFEYTAYQLKNPTKSVPMITGVQYPEFYNYNHNQTKELLVNQCERFIEFLENHRHMITNPKIFGGE